jgi:hypothetical protein
MAKALKQRDKLAPVGGVPTLQGAAHALALGFP